MSSEKILKSLRISNFRDFRVADTKLIERIPEKRIRPSYISERLEKLPRKELLKGPHCIYLPNRYFFFL